MEEVSFVFRECYEAVRELSGRFGLAGGSEGGPSEDVLPEHRFLALSLRRGAHPCASEIGMASGLYLPGRDIFRILAVQIRAKDGLRELTFRALRALLEAARERYGAHLCEWIYEWPAGKRDPHPSILARFGFPWLGTPTREVAGQRVFAASEKLSEPSLLHNRPCLSRESMARQGFADIPFASLEQGTLAGIRELLDSPTEDTEGLSPFVEAGEYDPELSFVSIDAKTGEVAGWVVCRPYGKYIELRRLYVARRFRRRRLGQFLGALVLRLIQEKSEGLVFLAHRERSSMQKIIRGYLRDTIVATHDLWRVTAETRS